MGGIKDASGIIGLIGGIFGIISVGLPAAYSYDTTYTYKGFEGTFIAAYWFFGVWFSTFRGSTNGSSTYRATSGFNIDIIGMTCAGMLISMGVLGIVMGSKIKNEYIDPKSGGATLLGMGCTCIVSLIVWLLFVPRLHLMRDYLDFAVSVRFWSFFDEIGPGVIIGAISSFAMIISGIIALLSEVKNNKSVN